MTYRLSLKLNLKPEHAGAVIDTLAPAVREAGLSFRNGAPGVIEGEGLSLMDLGLLVDQLSRIAESQAVSEWLPSSGLIDDLWLHVSAERA